MFMFISMMFLVTFYILNKDQWPKLHLIILQDAIILHS